MYVYEGTVTDLATALAESSFSAAAAQRFTQVFGTLPSPQEIRSWRRSWPRLADALSTAGLGRLHILLEYALPATGERVDALLVGQDTGGNLCTVVIELKQWTHAQLSTARPGMVRAGERVVQHPARQVGGYAHYLQQRVSHDDLPLTVRGVAMLHDAPDDLITQLREQAGRGPARDYPVLG